jgi:hypothetical protein
LKNASPRGERRSYRNTNATSRNAKLLERLFRLESNRDAFLARSFIFERARGEVHCIRFDDKPKVLHMQSAKLHCLYGKPILNCGRTRSSRVYPFACSKVYDLRQYTLRTRWGPFMNDGSDRVDWEKVEAILIVLGNNIRHKLLNSRPFRDTWESPFSGSWPNSYVPTPGRQLSSLDLEDPYGVSGTWLRVSHEVFVLFVLSNRSVFYPTPTTIGFTY